MRPVAVAAAVLLSASPLHAQPPLGALVGTFRFAGCDAFLCDDVTFRTYVSADATRPVPYFVTAEGTLAGSAAYFAAGNTGGVNTLGGRHGITPQPQYFSDWFDLPWFFSQPMSPAAPRYSYFVAGLPVDDPTVTGAGFGYYAFASPDDVETGNFESHGFRLDAVPLVTTPEPAPLALMGSGVLLLGLGRRSLRFPRAPHVDALAAAGAPLVALLAAAQPVPVVVLVALAEPAVDGGLEVGQQHDRAPEHVR